MKASHADFRLLTGARFLLALAVQSQAVLVGWLVYDLTKDPLYLGLIGLAEALPAIGLALYSGHLVDQGRPHAFYRNSILTVVCSSTALAVLASHPAFVPGGAVLPLVFAAIFLVGLARSFTGPSIYSLMAKIVPRSEFARSSAWLTSALQLSAVIGPAAAGFLYPILGPPAAFAVLAGISAAAIGAMSMMTAEIRNHRNVPKQRESARRSMSAGVRFVFGEPVLLGALTLDMFSVFFGGATAILPMFSDQILHAGPFGLGLLRSAFSLGAVLMSIRLIVRPLHSISGRTLLLVVAAFGAATIGFGLSRGLWLAMGCLFLAGGFDSVSMVIRSTILQLRTPDEMRGRVSSVNSIFIGSSNEIGAFESGVAARLLGLAPSIVFGGTMTLLVVALTASIGNSLRRARYRV